MKSSHAGTQPLQRLFEKEVNPSEIFVWIISPGCIWSISLVSRNSEKLHFFFFSIWVSGCSEKTQHMYTHSFAASPHSAAHTKQFKPLGSCWFSTVTLVSVYSIQFMVIKAQVEVPLFEPEHLCHWAGKGCKHTHIHTEMYSTMRYSSVLLLWKKVFLWILYI